MNFVINISGRRQIGTVWLKVEGMTMLPLVRDDGVELHYMEMRRDADTGDDYVALVYKRARASDR